MMSECEDCTLAVLADGDGGGGSHSERCRPCLELRSGDASTYVRPLSESDLELVLAWRSIPDVYRYSRSQDGPLDWKDHVDWFEKRPPTREDFVIHHAGRRVGVVALDTEDAISIYLGDTSARGEGVASKVIRWACNRFEHRTPIDAEVHEQNDASRRLFERCGFEEVERDGEWFMYRYKSA